MKKLLLVLGAVSLLITGCGAVAQPTPDTEDVTTSTTASYLSEEEALQIAYDYWKFTPGDQVAVGKGDGNDAKGTGSVRIAANPTEENHWYYEVVYSWVVPDSGHLSVLDRIWIHAKSGEIRFKPE